MNPPTLTPTVQLPSLLSGYGNRDHLPTVEEGERLIHQALGCAMDDLTPPPDHGDQQWMLSARCRSLAASEFFPSDGVGVDRARKICAQCEVQPECLEYALTYRIDHGVWGGASERERRRIMRRRRVEGSPTPTSVSIS